MDAAHILLWSLIALASLHLSVTMHHELKGHEYKIVQPIRLHAQNRKDTKSSETDRISYRLRIEGKNLDIHLKRSSRLISPNYTETHYTPNGTEVTSSPQHLDEQLCYYQGKVGNEQQSAVSMSTCNGLRGFFKAGEQSYIIEPLSESDTGDHAVFRYENLTVQGHYCGVTKQSWNPVLPHFNRKQRMDLMHGLSMKTQSVMEMDKYIEMYLVVDHSEFQKLQRDLSSVRLRMFEIINFVNMVYRPLNTFVALVGLEVWTNEDQIQIVPTASQTLSAFTHWRNTVLRKIRKHDNAQLISAVDFGTVVGMASVKSLCTMYSTALVRDYASSAALVGVVSAHELGHNLGMEHDVLPQCSCSPETCIMAPFLSAVPAQQFSSCSIEEYKQFLETYPGLQCLEDQPDESSLLSPPVCGNGFVEEGEQCDCGPVQNCTNPCCHAASCMFTVGSQCADGECCKNCKLLPFSRLCRSSVGECDLPEYCTGTSAECPEDVFKVNGLPCKNGTGYCYDGLCPRRQDQCTEIWGDHAEVAMKSCYDLNIEGTQNAYCKHPTPEEYIGCQPKDVMCGKLFCSNGTDEPLFGRKVVNGSCKATNYSDPTADYGQVLTGTKCGEGLVCNNSECVSLRAVYGDPNCTCSGHAVCNNKRQCQCKPGWIPPNCDEMYKQYILYSQDLEYGLNKEAFIGGGLSVGIVVLAVFMFVIIRTIRSRHHSRPLATVISNYYQQTGQVYSIPINPAQLMAIMEDAERFSKNGLDTDSPR